MFQKDGYDLVVVHRLRVDQIISQAGPLNLAHSAITVLGSLRQGQKCPIHWTAFFSQNLDFPDVLRAARAGNSPGFPPERIWWLKAPVHE